MAAPSRRWSIVSDAVDDVVRGLSMLPSSSRVDELRAEVAEVLRELDSWRVSAPTSEARNQLLNRVLNLHVEAAKLRRRSSVK